MATQAINDYTMVEDAIHSKREQRTSVKGKITPFRVEFRFGRGHVSWQYFETLAEAKKGNDVEVGYGPTGHAYSRSPRSQIIQQRGPRGGWSSVREAK